MEVVFDALESAAGSVSRIGSLLDEANLAAAFPTANIVPPGAEVVSAAITELFNKHGALFRELAQSASAFQRNFAGQVMSARTAYLGAERDAENMFTSGVTNIEDVSGLTSVIQRLTGDVEVAGFTPIPLPTDTNTVITLALGGTGGPNPPQSWAQQIATAWGGGTGYGLTSPEQGFPTTPQLGHLTFNQSFAQDVTLLNTAIHQELLQGNTITVYGISQSSTAVCLELRNLAAQRYPGVGNLSFILQGDPSNPNGGFLERINGLYVPGLDLRACLIDCVRSSA